MDIIAVGEMVIDFIPGKEADSYIKTPGGAPANVAVSVARNGLSAGIYCKVGDDEFGRYLIRILRENRVVPLCETLCREAVTTMAFVALTPKGERSFTFARKPGADMFLNAAELCRETLKEGRIIYSGSCALSKGKAREAAVFALRCGHELGCLVSFDVNYRGPMWEGDRLAAAKMVRQILPYVDLLKISKEEADLIGGRDRIFSVMRENHIAAVIETLGAEGARYYFNEAVFHIKGRKEECTVDTTGAGDAFFGSFLSKLLLRGVVKASDLTREDLEDGIRYGNAAGALCIQSKGAIASLPDRNEIEHYLQQLTSDDWAV